MPPHRKIGIVLVVAVALMAILAYLIGPPTTTQKALPPIAGVLPLPEPKMVSILADDDVSVRSFGAIPRCGDDIAIRTVIAALRRYASVHISGLSNISDLGAVVPGQNDCEAIVEIGQGRARVRYRVARLTGQTDKWILTVFANQPV